MKFCPRVGLLIAAMALSGISQAGLSTAEMDFRSGIAAFQDGDIGKARVFLEQARDSGLESSSLLYNLGVVYFRLDLLDQAETAFTELLDTPHAPLARYNLGLVLKKKGDVQGARTWFHQAAGDPSPDEVRALAKQQLASLPSRSSEYSATGAGAPPERGGRLMSNVGFLSTAAGYDNNIASTPNSAATNRAGAFADLLASGRVYLNQQSGSAIRLDALAYNRQYPGNGEFDNTYFSAGAAWQKSLETARLLSGITLSGFWFGADLLERQARLNVAYDRPGCFWPDVLAVDCEIEVFAAKIQGGTGFRAYDGELYGGSVGVEKRTEHWNFGASYRLDVDRRKDLMTENEFFSLSPTRHNLLFSVERQVTDRLSLGLSQTVRFTRYADPHRLSGNGQIRVDTREDDQFRSLLFAGYQLDSRWRLGMESGWLDNQSSLERYQYQQAEFLISLDAVF